MTDAELLTQLETAIANHPGYNVVQEGDKRIEYGDIADLVKQADALRAKIAVSAGTFSYRTYAKNGGRG